MAKLTLTDVANLYGNPTTAANTINANNALIEAALENTLSRDGSTPNQMDADLDMNHNDILNAHSVSTDVLYIDGVLVIPTDIAQIPDNSVSEQQIATSFKNKLILRVSDRTTQATIDPSIYGHIYLEESGREGNFTWKTGNFTALVAVDGMQGIYVPSSIQPVTAGCWVRVFNGAIHPKWFGAVGDGTTNDYLALNAWLTMATLPNFTCLRLDAGSFVSNLALAITTSYNVMISGESEEISKILFTGSTAGIKLTSNKYNVMSGTTADSRPFFGARDFTILTSNTLGTQDALSFQFPYFHSSQHREFDIGNITIDVISAQTAGAQKWRNAIRIRNGWNGNIRNVTGNQHVDVAANYSGSGVYLDGLSPSVNIQDCNFQWWNAAVENGYMILKKMVGTVTGTFWMHEVLVGGTSGATARVARMDGYGSSNLVAMEVAGTFVNGETVTGQSSGATIHLTATPVDIQQSNEGVYFLTSDAVACNYGILSLQPSTVITPGVGLWVFSSHFNVTYAAIQTAYHHQANIVGNLVYTQGSGSTAFTLDNGSNHTIVGNTILGPGTANTTGVGLSNSGTNSVTGNTFQNLVTGIAVAATVTNSQFDASNKFISCTTNISNLGPNWPTANWNVVDDNIWFPYTAMISASSGSLTTASASGRYRLRGKTVEICIVGSITTNGTAAGTLYTSLPGGILPASAAMLSGRGTAVSGAAITGQVGPTISQGVSIVTATGTYPGSDGYGFTLTGIYEIA